MSWGVKSAVAGVALAVALVLFVTIRGARVDRARPLDAGAADRGTTHSAAVEVAADGAAADREAQVGVVALRAGAADASGASARDLEPRVSVRGRVVDAARRPVKGATVVLSMTDRAIESSSTDEEGRYEFEVTSPDAADRGARASLFASATVEGIACCGVQPLFHYRLRVELELQPACLRADPLVLRPGGALAVRVVDGSGPVAGARVRFELGESRERGPDLTADETGMLVIAALPPGSVIVRGRSGSGARGHADAEVVAGTARDVDLRLEPPRALVIEVLHAEDRVPIEGARVELFELVKWRRPGSRYAESEDFGVVLDGGTGTSDARGEVRFDGLEGGSACFAQVTKPGLEWRDGRGPDEPGSFATIAPDAARVRLALGSPRIMRMRWPIAPGRYAPREGDELRLAHGFVEGHAAPETARVEGGFAIVDVPETRVFETLALAPGGGIAVLSTARDRFSDESGARVPVVFGPARRLVVRVSDADGPAALGRRVLAHPKAELFEHVVFPFAGTTDARGAATFDALPAIAYEIAVDPDGELGECLPFASVDLAASDAEIDVVVPAPHAVRFVITAGGERRLPAELVLRAFDLPSRRRERAELGEIELWFVELGRDMPPVHFEAPGFVAMDVRVPPLVRGAIPRVPVALEAAASLVVEFAAAEDSVLRPTLQSFDAERGAFSTTPGTTARIQEANGPDGTYRFEDLPPARYRVVEGVSGIVSEEIALGGGEQRRLVVDLRRSITVSGRCELPDDLDAELVQLEFVDETRAGQADGDGVDEDGTREVRLWRGEFEATLDGTRRWRLRARLPFHRLAAPGGSIAITGTMRDLVLRFEEAPLARFVATGSVGEFVQASCYQPGRHDRSVAWCPVRGRGPVREFAPPSGRWDVLLWPAAGVPRLLEGIGFDDTGRDLGEIAFERGSTLTVRLRTEGDPPYGYVDARKLDGALSPLLDRRGTEATHASEHRLVGLTRGRWRVVFEVVRDEPQGGPPSVEVEVDGVNDRTIELPVDG